MKCDQQPSTLELARVVESRCQSDGADRECTPRGSRVPRKLRQEGTSEQSDSRTSPSVTNTSSNQRPTVDGLDGAPLFAVSEKVCDAGKDCKHMRGKDEDCHCAVLRNSHVRSRDADDTKLALRWIFSFGTMRNALISCS